MDVLNRIMELLERSGRNQKELMDHLGIKKSAFTDWKAGKSRSYLKYASEIADYFGVTTDYLLRGETDKKVNLQIGKNKPDYMILFDALPEKDQKEVVAFIEFKAAQNADHVNTYRVAARGGMKTITMTDEEKEAFIEETEKAAKQKLPDDLI